jgi:hypothetical protein
MTFGVPAWELAVLGLVTWLILVTWYNKPIAENIEEAFDSLDEHKDDIIVSVISLIIVGRATSLNDEFFLEWISGTSAIFFVVSVGAALGASRSGRGILEWLRGKSK